VAPRSPAPSAGSDAGPPADLTLKTMQSMFEATKLLKRNAAEAAAYIERYCAETAKLPKHLFNDPPGADPGHLRDAAYFMEPLVSWETHPRSEGTLQLPQPLVDKIQAAHDDWATALSATDTVGLDFSWMTQLLSYDTWSLASVGAVADQAGIVDPFWAPIPYYPTLVQYGKLRYVRALAQGDLGQATTEVQHLADLMHTSGLLIGDFQAAKLLVLGQQLEAATLQRGYPALPPPPLDSASYDQFHDLSLAGTAFVMPGVDEAVMQRAMDCVPDPCAAINEAIGMHREMERLAESDDSAFWVFAESHTCDLPFLRLIKGSPSGRLDALSGYLSDNGAPSLPLEKLFGPEIAPNAAQ
jgi:hypothetical protein